MKKIKLFSVCLAISFLASSCEWKPIVDMKDVDKKKYQQDLKECKEYESQVDENGQTLQSAAIGAVAGAAVGAITGSLDGEAGIGAAAGAGYGGIYGTGTEQGRQSGERKKVLRNCLIRRGYNVLN